MEFCHFFQTRQPDSLGLPVEAMTAAGYDDAAPVEDGPEELAEAGQDVNAFDYDDDRSGMSIFGEMDANRGHEGRTSSQLANVQVAEIERLKTLYREKTGELY